MELSPFGIRPTIRCYPLRIPYRESLLLDFTVLSREQCICILFAARATTEPWCRYSGTKSVTLYGNGKLILRYSFLRRFVLPLGSCYTVRRLSLLKGIGTSDEAPDMNRKSTFRTMDSFLGAALSWFFIFVWHWTRAQCATFDLVLWLCSKGR